MFFSGSSNDLYTDEWALSSSISDIDFDSSSTLDSFTVTSYVTTTDIEPSSHVTDTESHMTTSHTHETNNTTTDISSPSHMPFTSKSTKTPASVSKGVHSPSSHSTSPSGTPTSPTLSLESRLVLYITIPPLVLLVIVVIIASLILCYRRYRK